MPGVTQNGWGEWSKFVLKELERLDDEIKCLNDKIGEISISIAELKIKAGIWGVLGGAVPVLIGLAIYFLEKA